MNTSPLNLLLTLLLLAHSVAAHGWVAKIEVASKTYNGNTPPSTTTPSVIRPVSTWTPVTGATSPSLNCGMNATKATQVATVAAGSELKIYWKTMMLPAQLWFHNTGPILTYMASCGSTACSSFDSTKAKWFKISELGQEPGKTTWYQANLMTGAPANVTVPSNLKAGNYLMRHEVINMGRADGATTGITEFFPSCSQLEITGSGTGAPEASELVSFPGAYTDKEPSIFDSAYNYVAGAYKFPGPAVAAFVSGSSSSGGSSNSSSSESSSKTAGSSSASATSAKAKSTKAASSTASVPAESTPAAASTPAESVATSSAKATNTKGSCKSKSTSSTKSTSQRKRSPAPAPESHSHPASDSYADSTLHTGSNSSGGRMRRHSRHARASHGSA
ncbi:lytic polysaccharide monooxygenase [Athelia psychrophila]|uniref:lytic cellulose monooxygenase (C4-dehydrogenating) n=1 Tax=Athelia psychrophila TaxID=1759441 RepID=A0A165Y3N4_9AGAM|nr:lytic polysaccharide monooxygenase [Fibularhizoctonia sp. CBS 109695]